MELAIILNHKYRYRYEALRDNFKLSLLVQYSDFLCFVIEIIHILEKRNEPYRQFVVHILIVIFCSI